MLPQAAQGTISRLLLFLGAALGVSQWEVTAGENGDIIRGLRVQDSWNLFSPNSLLGTLPLCQFRF